MHNSLQSPVALTVAAMRCYLGPGESFVTRNYYTVLQVSRNAEQEVIEAAYKRLAGKYHPDVYSGADGADRMRELNEAYEVLGDAGKRAE